MSSPSPRQGARPPAEGAALKAFIARIHFYAGLLVGPFLLVAALTGTLYVLTPQIEDRLYADALTTASTGTPRPLAEQVEAARAHAGGGARVLAVRPATAPDRTTRVMFADPALGPSETRAVFVDPQTLTVRGDMTAYGSSGILPFRTALDYLHRNLMLGEFGRAYSELAASWLWILALGGIALWAWRRTGRMARRAPGNTALSRRRTHGLLGVTLSVGLLFLSVTGLTWSQWAGGRIDGLRNALGWTTPSVSLALTNAPAAAESGDHGDHGHAMDVMDAAMPGDPATRLDAVLAAARSAGIDSPFAEIRPPREAGQAWLVREYDRSWPTQVDTIALHPETLAVTSRADFATFPFVAKLVQWGIAAHMGILFGVANQIVMAGFGLGLVVLVLYGYRIWWRSRPAPGAMPQTLLWSWLRLSPALRLASVALALALGWVLPLVGASLLAFLLVDAGRWTLSRRRATGSTLAADQTGA